MTNALPARTGRKSPPIDLAGLIKTGKPIVRARYEYAERGEPSLGALIDAFLTRIANRATRGAAQ